MRILIHCIHYPVCSGRYAVEAFRRLGHEAFHAGREMGRSVWGLQVPSEYTWNNETPPQEWQPDLAILMDTAYRWRHPVAPTVVWSVDNHVRDLKQDGIQHYFLAHKSVSLMDWRDDMTWMPCAGDATFFTPSPIPFAERKYDVCMLGVMYPERQRMVAALRAAGLKVFAGTGLVYEAYRDAYQDSRISLCQSIRGDVAQRVFETAQMGCLLMTDPMPDAAELGIPNTVYGSTEQAIAQIHDLLEHPANELIADTTRAWAQQHTWEARAQVILDWASGTAKFFADSGNGDVKGDGRLL